MRLPLHSVLGAIAATLLTLATPAAAQGSRVVDASAPRDMSVTIYRDPNRAPSEQVNRDWPEGFAMITETREVTLPPGESTIRFTGVAEGMVAVSAIVTGLPGGTIEKNRDANLLSPAALVDGTLGNRVTITRTNPGTGEETSESAIIRTRADGGLVLETGAGFEAVRCSGLPERLEFPAIPDGLSPEPVFSLDTADPRGGTYTVELTYLAWGFDWQANYVATLREGGDAQDMRLHLLSWLTLLNDNGQSFEDAELLVVAGTLNVVSDFEDLADAPRARPLALTCYPIGSTARGSPVRGLYSPAPPPPPPSAPRMARAVSADQMMEAGEIVVTGSRVSRAEEEDLGDLKLYRVPGEVTVAAKSMKQVAFLDQDDVTGRLLYRTQCVAWQADGGAQPAQMLFATRNDRQNGLGMALPSGAIAFFEPTPFGDLLVAEETLRDYASGQDVEIPLGDSAQVFADCERVGAEPDRPNRWQRLKLSLTNANPRPVTVRVMLGYPSQFDHRGLRTQMKDGQRITEITVPANSARDIEFEQRQAGAA